MLDDNGNPVSEETASLVRERRRIPPDLRFPPSSGKFCDSPAARANDWLLNYFTLRGAQKVFTPAELVDYFGGVGMEYSRTLDRFRGALVGTAIGDAFGTTLEFKPKGSFTPITEMQGGGPFNLEKGQWTDDTSMMYCLAHSLTRKNGFDAEDQMSLYKLWRDEGVFSSNGHCFDIGQTVDQALNSYARTGNPYSGSTDPMSAGNGSLMRLAPIPLFYFNDFEQCVHFAGLSSKTTHQATEAVEACRYYAALIWGALHGASKETLLSGLYAPMAGYWDNHPLTDTVASIAINAEYKTKSESEIRGSGYVMHSLEASLWAFYHSSNFEDGLLRSVNLGEDADTTGAIYGQLAGAYYGEGSIHFKWIRHLSYAHAFYLKAKELYDLK